MLFTKKDTNILANKRQSTLTLSSAILQKSLKSISPILECLPPTTRYNLTILSQYKFLWFRVAKVATRSIFAFLDRSNVGLDADQAMSCIYFPKLHSNYFKFAFVRNLWSRFYSLWRNQVIDRQILLLNPRNDYNKCQDFEFFTDFIVDNWQDELIYLDPHLRPQSQLIDIKNVNFFGRFETFGNDFLRCMKIINLDPSLIDQIPCNSSSRVSTGDLIIRQRSIDQIHSLYEKDITLFNYSFAGF